MLGRASIKDVEGGVGSTEGPVAMRRVGWHFCGINNRVSMLGRATIKDVEGGVGSTEGHRGAYNREKEIYHERDSAQIQMTGRPIVMQPVM